MCAHYKPMPTLENPQEPDQLPFFDEDLIGFPMDFDSPLDPFDQIRQYIDQINYYTNNTKENIDKINSNPAYYDIEDYNDAMKNYINNLKGCLQAIKYIFTNELNENIDDFLEETDFILFLFDLIDYRDGFSIGTENSAFVLNILAHIAKISPNSLDVCLNGDIHNLTVMNAISLLKDLIRSPDLLPEIISTLLLSIDENPQVIDILIQKDMIYVLAEQTLKFKLSGIQSPEIIGPLSTLISILFDHVPSKVEVEDYDVIWNAYKELPKLINTIPFEYYKKKNTDIKLENLCPLLNILRKYLECFIANKREETPSLTFELKDIMTEDVTEVILELFTNPLNIDPSGKIFNQTLAIYDQVLRIDPGFFDLDLIEILFKFIFEYDEIRLDILFFLSNVVKYQEATLYILEEKLITRYEFLNRMDEFSYLEKENALISLLTIIYIDARNFYTEIKGQDFTNIIYEFIENSSSTTNDYYNQIFLCVMRILLSDYPDFIANVDNDDISDCLASLSENPESKIADVAQSLIETYFSDNE